MLQFYRSLSLVMVSCSFHKTTATYTQCDILSFFLFLFFTRRSCTKKEQSLSSAVDPCIVKIRIDMGIGSELKVSLDEGPKVICSWEAGQRKKVPVTRRRQMRWFG